MVGRTSKRRDQRFEDSAFERQDGWPNGARPSRLVTMAAITRHSPSEVALSLVLAFPTFDAAIEEARRRRTGQQQPRYGSSSTETGLVRTDRAIRVCYFFRASMVLRRKQEKSLQSVAASVSLSPHQLVP
jgi:hypothetical protein